MDDTTDRFAYRCTPLSIANSSGWELLVPSGFAASWNGGLRPADITIMGLNDDGGPDRVVTSAFGHGVLTFHPGYLFRTSPGWAITARGAPNSTKDGIVALEGLVETDWLPFTFTMNWRFTRPGMVRFEKGECFCFLSLIPHAVLDSVQPTLHDIAEDTNLMEAYQAWREGRADFQARLLRGEQEAVRQGWQRDYLYGRDPSNRVVPVFHISKRQLRKPL